MKKTLSLVMRIAMMISIMAIFMSCTHKSENLNTDSEEIVRVQDLNQDMVLALDKIVETKDLMLIELQNLASFLDQEKLYYKGAFELEDYDSFMDQSAYNPLVIEDNFSKANQDYLDGLESISSQDEDYYGLNELLAYEAFLAQLFQDMMAYHYAMLEADYHLEVFGNAMNGLYELLISGDLPSVEYNDSLDMILSQYSALLEVGSGDNDLGGTYNKEELSIMIGELKSAKSQVANLEVVNAFDLELNTLVYQMLDSVERASSVTYEFEVLLDRLSYKTGETLMNDSAVDFLEETLKMNAWPLE